jgi:hypothetical protein
VFQARRVEAAGAVGVVVLDNSGGGSSALFAMSGDGKDDVRIPVLFLLQQDALQLLQAVSLDPELEVTLSEQGETEAMDARLLDSILDKLKGSVQDFLAKQSDEAEVSRHFFAGRFLLGNLEKLHAPLRMVIPDCKMLLIFMTYVNEVLPNSLLFHEVKNKKESLRRTYNILSWVR